MHTNRLSVSFFIVAILSACQGPRNEEAKPSRVEEYVSETLQARAAANLPLNVPVIIPSSMMAAQAMPLSPQMPSPVNNLPSAQSAPVQPPPMGGPSTSPAAGAPLPGSGSAVADILGVVPPPFLYDHTLVINVSCKGTMLIKMSMASGPYYTSSPVSVFFTYRENRLSSATPEEITNLESTYLGIARQSAANQIPGIQNLKCNILRPCPQAPQTQPALASASDACSAAPNIVGD